MADVGMKMNYRLLAILRNIRSLLNRELMLKLIDKDIHSSIQALTIRTASDLQKREAATKLAEIAMKQGNYELQICASVI